MCCSENCGRWVNEAQRREIACISDLKMLMLASEISIYARTAEIK